MNCVPTDLGMWLEDIDVTCLSDTEADELARFDVTTAEGLESLVHDWIAPRFAMWDEYSQLQMKKVSAKSLGWSAEDLRCA